MQGRRERQYPWVLTRPRTRQRARAARPDGPLLIQSEVLSRAENGAHDAILLPQVGGRVALARARTPTAPDVTDRHRTRGILEPVTKRAPGTHVLGLFLRPDELRQARVRRKQLAHGVHRERVELLET